MRSMNVVPRALADDVLLTSSGDCALTLFTLAFTATLEHLTNSGGRLAPAKSVLMATSSAHRAWLSQRHWPIVDTTIRVVTNTRDLGSHINLGSTTATHLSRERLS
eukprot:6830896-Karenia_brevis.AAC.1